MQALVKERKTEDRDGMRIHWDAVIETSDGILLRADVFRPIKEGKYPVLLSYGPYAKGLSFQEGYPSAWNRMITQHPDVPYGSTNKYQNWEVVDPEKWVPHEYVVVRVDSRGCGASPGVIDPFSPRETQDFVECIEWAGTQAWSNGKVGLSGVSYFGMNQWLVASRRPKYLEAMCIWEGASDWYRDATHHGGIVSTFWAHWYDMQVKSVQHGLGERGFYSRVHGEPISGVQTFSDDELQKNRISFGDEILAHPLIDDWHRDRMPIWNNIEVPLLSAGNWGGQGLHLRGNVEGFLRSSSKQKWLEMHGLEHWTHYYTDYGRDLQLRFFDYFLKGKDNGWDKQPKVLLQVRDVKRGFVERHADAWPLPETEWTKLYLNTELGMLTGKPPTESGHVSYDAASEGVTFLTAPLTEDLSLIGSGVLKVKVSSSTTDTDVFVVLTAFSPDMRELTYQGAIDPHTPIAQGWLRASHRKLDPEQSTHWRPIHAHDELHPLTPNEPVWLNIEILPTSIVIPKGWRLGLIVRGKDYEYAETTGSRLSNFKNELKGCGPFLHDEPRDRPTNVYAGTTTIYVDVSETGYLLLPKIAA